MNSDMILQVIAIIILIPIITGVVAITKDIIEETFFQKNNDTDKHHK